MILRKGEEGMRNRPKALEEWIRVVTGKMRHLSKPQAVVLAMWSFGIVVTQCSGLTTVAVFLAELLNKPENTVREQLKQWYKEGGEKQGRRRAEIEVKQSFVPILQWIISWWSKGEKNLVIAADATTLGQRFTLLVFSVVYRGCGIPVAWKVVEATVKGSWKEHWLELLKQLEPGVPKDWWVIVTTDRGLYANWFYTAIQEMGWHPFMRINHHQGSYRVEQRQEYIPLNSVCAEVGTQWCGRVTCFKTNSLDCTLLASWGEDYADPWLIVTDLNPSQAWACWYGMRCWIECMFKDIKRGGLQWQRTQMTDPNRAERLWLAITVAILWSVSVGGQADAQLPASSLPDMSTQESSQLPLSSLSAIPRPARILSCFRRGYLVILASVIKGLPLPCGRFIPDFSPAHG
jgi:hypothetical protein